MKRSLIVALAAAFTASLATAQELNCLTDAERTAAALYAQLQEQAYKALDRRTQTYEQLTNAEQIAEYQQRLRKFFIDQLGGFPERTPLNAQTVRTIQAEGYRIELVIFESQPNHHVTANLYLPESQGPVPGVVVSSGHSRTAKTAEYNQRFGIMMARHGMAALCFDPIGQGERSQILDDHGGPLHSGTTTEHSLVGVSSILVGRNTATFRIWDAMRSIDYLTERPEIDPRRIGVTGCSGGGTLTSYVMALDDRVACAAPACYLTTFRKLIETIGPQDAEQNIHGQLQYGLDQPDYVLLRAPRPTLISATTADFFDIHGTWDNFRQAKRIYGRLGYPERVDLVEIEGEHGVQPENLAAIAQWMKRWLLHDDGPVSVAEIATRKPEELLCTKTGQVLTAFPNEKSVVDLNAEHEAKLAEQRQKLWASAKPDQMASKIRELLGVKAERKPTTWEDRGRVEKDGYHIDKLVMRSDSGAVLPALTFHPPSPADAAYLYLHDAGKLGDSQAGGPIEELVASGHAVVTVDLRGQGETGLPSGRGSELLPDAKTYFLAYLLGESLVGLRTDDALAAADFVAYYQKQRNDPREVHLVGVGRAGVVALHAAAMNPGLFTSVTLRKTPRDWASIVRNANPAGRLDVAVHGALKVYDLPDLVRLVGADKVRFED